MPTPTTLLFTTVKYDKLWPPLGERGGAIVALVMHAMKHTVSLTENYCLDNSEFFPTRNTPVCHIQVTLHRVVVSNPRSDADVCAGCCWSGCLMFGIGSCQPSRLDLLISCYTGVFEGGGSVWQGMNNVFDVAAEAPVVRMVVLRVYSLPGQSALFFVKKVRRGGQSLSDTPTGQALTSLRSTQTSPPNNHDESKTSPG